MCSTASNIFAQRWQISQLLSLTLNILLARSTSCLIVMPDIPIFEFGNLCFTPAMSFSMSLVHSSADCKGILLVPTWTITYRFSCLICFNLVSNCSAIDRVTYRFSCWICFNPVSNGSAIINMMIGSRLYSVNVNYTSEMIFLALVIVYGDKAILQIQTVMFVYIVLWDEVVRFCRPIHRLEK